MGRGFGMFSVKRSSSFFYFRVWEREGETPAGDEQRARTVAAPADDSWKKDVAELSPACGSNVGHLGPSQLWERCRCAAHSWDRDSWKAPVTKLLLHSWGDICLPNGSGHLVSTCTVLAVYDKGPVLDRDRWKRVGTVKSAPGGLSSSAAAEARPEISLKSSHVT